MAKLGSDKFGANQIKFVRALGAWFNEFGEDALGNIRDACWNADVVITNFLGVAGLSVAEKRDIPAFLASMFPVLAPTRAYPSLTTPFMHSLGGILNALTHRFEQLSMTIPFNRIFNKFRLDYLELPSVSPLKFPYDSINGKQLQVLLAYSPHLIPRPPDYPPHVHVTGYWFLDEAVEWTPPPGLEAFLNADEPPVYIGFGSMIDNNADAMSRIVIRALHLSRQRGLLLGGWGHMGLVTQNEEIFVVSSAPHDWLFQKLAAVVHHGGAGTTAAGLRAGKPSILIPFMGDQPWWGARIYEHGIGPPPIPANKINPENLAEAIQTAIHDLPMRSRAAQIGEKIRQEKGLENTVDIIERVAGAHG
jgi:sterol 3beta-glucosyltransferase